MDNGYSSEKEVLNFKAKKRVGCEIERHRKLVKLDHEYFSK